MPAKKQSKKKPIQELPPPRMKYDYSQTGYFDIDKDGPISEKEFYGDDWEKIKDLDRKRQFQYEKERLAYDKARYLRETEEKDKIKKEESLTRLEKARFGRNYFARDWINNVTNWTASSIAVKKPFNAVGLRMELVSPGYAGKTGMPSAPTGDVERRTRKASRGYVGGSLSVGVKSTVNLKPRVSAVLLDLNPIGRGDVIMPQVLKIKKRKRL
jgi:hypothetical protein